MHRLFVALDLPELAADSLTQLQTGLDGARWAREENLHLTLAFIGEVDRHGLQEIHSALSGVKAQGFDLRLSGCGYFGDAKPRQLWAGVEPSAALSHLQAKVANALRAAGFLIEKRKFKPHVTIAGLRSVSRPAVETFAAMHSLYAFGPFPVDAFHLIESHPGNEGAHFEIRATYALVAPR